MALICICLQVAFQDVLGFLDFVGQVGRNTPASEPHNGPGIWKGKTVRAFINAVCFSLKLNDKSKLHHVNHKS